MRFIFSFLLFLGLFSIVLPQSQYLSKGDFYFERGEYKLSQINYEKYLEEVPFDANVNLKLLQVYIENFNVIGAKKCYQALVSSSFKHNIRYRFLEARYYHLLGDYKLALKLYQKLGEASPSGAINVFLGQCEVALMLEKKSIKFKPFYLPGIDSSKHNLFPIFNANEDAFIYSSDRGNHTSKTHIFKVCGEKISLISDLNDSVFSSVCVGSSPDFNTLFIYKGVNGGDLFYSTYKNDKYSQPMPFAFNTADKESAVTVSPDGNQLIFVRESDEGSDLYTSYLSKDSVWSNPVLFELNSSNNERTPFFHPSGQLLFYSVDGTGSIGGYDVVYSVKEGDRWSSFKNLGSNINSPGDDLGFNLLLSGGRAVYSSNNKQGKQTLRGVDLVSPFDVDYLHFKGFLVDEDSLGVEAKFYLRNLDNGNTIRSFRSKTNGEFSFVFEREGEYSLQILAKGFKFKSVKLSVVYNKEKERCKTIVLSRGNSKPTVLENIHFGPSSAQLSQESFYELDNLVDYLEQNHKLNIEIVGHTDNLGDDEFNKMLSLSRANSVKRYLLLNGINLSRISTKGMGELIPLVSNSTELNRAINRRVVVVFK